MSESEATKLILGATKTGVLTPANIQTSWSRLSEVDKLKLRKQNPPVTNIEEYQDYRLQGGPERPGGVASGPAAGGASSSGKTPPLPSGYVLQ